MKKRVLALLLALCLMLTLAPAAFAAQKCAAPEISYLNELYGSNDYIFASSTVTVNCSTPGARLHISINGAEMEGDYAAPYVCDANRGVDIGFWMVVYATAPGYAASEEVECYLAPLWDTVSLRSSLVTAYPSRSASSFSDVARSDWYWSDLNKLVKCGSINGMTGTTFAPSGTMTVAEYMKLLVTSLYGDSLDAFTPTAMGASMKWYHKYVNAAMIMGVATGVDTSEAHLTQPVNRYEMAVMLSNAAQILDYYGFPTTANIESCIADYASIPSQYRDAVKKAYSNGLLGGIDGQGTFAGGNSLKRCEACATIVRLFDASARLKVPTPVNAQSYIGGWGWTGESTGSGEDYIPPNKGLYIESISGSTVRFSYGCMAGMWLFVNTFNEDDGGDIVTGTLTGNVIKARVMDGWETIYDLTITLLGDTVEVDVTEIEAGEFRRYAFSDAVLTRGSL